MEEKYPIINWGDVEVGTEFIANIGRDTCSGKIQRHRGLIYLCQDTMDGVEIEDRLGYKYSWCIGNGSVNDLTVNDVTYLKIIGDPMDLTVHFKKITKK